VIAWERFMRETERAAASTIRRRLAALSSLYKYLIRHGHAPRNPVGEVERPAITATKARHSPSRGRRRARSPTRRPKIRSRGFAIARSFLSPHKSDCSAPRSRR
jgi:site-specific recombinase XerC